METRLAEPLPPAIQLILGVFTVAQHREYRQVVRETWLQQAGVCYIRSQPKAGCSVYVAFVMGKNGTGDGGDGRPLDERPLPPDELAAAQHERGVLVLDIAENMNRGKSQAWFRSALWRYPFATHIAKMDMDTYPFVHKLVGRMDVDRQCVGRSSPYDFIGRPHNTFGEVFASTCSSSPKCTVNQFVLPLDRVPVGSEWRFLSGEFYILSRPLVEKVNWADTKFFYTEDAAVSRLVNRAAKTHGFCVVLRRLDAWYHRNRLCDPSFANDF